MKKKLLLFIPIVLVIMLSFIGCQRITQEDVDRQSSRWWVITYKMMEDGMSMQTNERITGLNGVEETLEKEFGNFIEQYDKASLKDQYNFAKRRNELMEEALIELKGEATLEEIEGVWSLDEVPELWEKVNKAEE